MGRHTASGSDGLGQGNTSAPGGRRRTDPVDGSWPGRAPELSDHPTAPGRERRRDVPLDVFTEPPRQMSRSRLPLPPVPAASRTAAASSRAAATPVEAVPPTPRSGIERPAPARAAEVPAPAPPVHAGGEQPVRPVGKVAVADVAPSPAWPAEEFLATTGRGQGLRTAAPRVPRVPRQTTPAGTPSSSYGDWTKPSRTDETGRSRLGRDGGSELQRVPLAPATTAIPERGAAARRSEVTELEADFDHYGVDDPYAPDDRYADHADADLDDDVAVPAGAPAPVGGPGTGPGTRSRATYRAERQAADAARRKAAKRNGTPDVLFDDDDERKPRRVLTGLVAMALVAGAVLGVYTVTQPGPTEPVAQAEAAVASTPPPVAPPTEALPPLNTLPLDVEAVATPVRVPVTVLNATNVTGLAGRISDTVVAGGWESPGAGAYRGPDVAATTVFFTEGDEQQRQAALQLIEQFPDLAGPAPRFFEVTDVPAPGLVVVATGNWQP